MAAATGELRSGTRGRGGRRSPRARPDRHEVRRHLGRRHAEDQGRRPPARRRARDRPARRRRALGHGRHDRRADPARPRGLAAAAPARVRHARLGRRAHLERALRDGDPRPRPRGRVAHGLAGRDRHRHGAREGKDRRGPRAPPERGARQGPDRARRGLPGRLDRARGDDARPRRLRCDRRRARVCARRRVRDLHRRRGRLHRGSARRPRRAEAAADLLRGDARDGGERRARDDGAVDRDRAQVRCSAPRPCRARRNRRHVDRRGGRARARKSDHLRSHARHVGGEGRRSSPCPTAPASPRASSARSPTPA